MEEREVGAEPGGGNKASKDVVSNCMFNHAFCGGKAEGEFVEEGGALSHRRLSN
jgi:hypothetical protein